jgi:hypothetical protein
MSRRVLRPTGRIGIVSLAQRRRETNRLYNWTHMHFPHSVDCRPIAVHTLLERAGVHPRDVTETAIWGLPRDIVLALK